MHVAYLVELGLPVSHSLSVWCRCCASRVRGKPLARSRAMHWKRELAESERCETPESENVREGPTV